MAVEDSLDIFGSDPFGRDYLYGLGDMGNRQGLAPYGFRYAENLSQPTTTKKSGYLGDVGGYVGDIGEPRSVMSELSASSEIGGRTVQYPLIVPTLTAQELMLLHSGGKPTPEIYDKAQSWAVSRLQQGQDPFANPVGLRYPQPEGFNPAPRAADQVQESPRGFTSGLFSDVFGRTLNMPSIPRTGIPALDLFYANRNSLFNAMGVGDVQKTAERISYGQPLTTGSGMTTKPREETIFAGMAVAPFAPVVGRLASRAIRATEGMPVGMGIKDVGKSAITKEGNPIQGAVVLVGDKIFMGRTHGDALNRAVYEGAVRKEGGKYIYPKGAEVNSDLFMTKDGQIIDRLQASKMFDIGASETAIEKGLMQNNPPKSMTVDSYIEQATALKKQREQSPYPQQAALDLAQQRAALPVEQGGLGLPANNTPMDRAKAMGFDINNPLYHATDVDFESIRPSLQGKLGAGVYVSPSSQYAEKYTSLNAAGNARVLPLVARGKLADDDVAMNIAESIRQEMAAQNPNFSVSEWKKRTTQALADAGYDGRNMSGFESVITNPSNVRSRFAAFDPFRKDVATATAMGVALPDLLAQPVNQYQNPYETLPMYTDPFGNTIGSSIR